MTEDSGLAETSRLDAEEPHGSLSFGGSMTEDSRPLWRFAATPPEDASKSNAEDKNESEDGARSVECRICQLVDDMRNLITPCDCAGSMKYVHLECLEAWRRQSPGNALRCGVCRARYSHVIHAPPPGAAQVLYVVSRFCLLWERATWAHDGPARRALVRLCHAPDPGCCVLRLFLWAGLFFVAVVLGRVALLVIAFSHEAVMAIDRTFDPVFLSPEVLSLFHQIFPTMSGFGYLEICDALSAYLALAWADGNATANESWNINDVGGEAVPSSAEACWQRASAHLQQSWTSVVSNHFSSSGSCWQLPQTLDDIILGAFVLLIGVHMIAVSGEALRPVRENVRSPLADMCMLLQTVVPDPALLPVFILIVIPFHAYLSRWVLSKLNILPMEALPFHKHAAVHLLLSVTVLSVMEVFHSSAEFLGNDFGVWYASYTLAARNNVNPAAPERHGVDDNGRQYEPAAGADAPAGLIDRADIGGGDARIASRSDALAELPGLDRQLHAGFGRSAGE